MVLDTRNKNMYGLGVGFSIVFKIFSKQIPVSGGGEGRGRGVLTPGAMPNVLHILPVTQGTRTYLV
jgi:hypothetical protein